MIGLVVVTPVRFYRECLVGALNGLSGMRVLGHGSTLSDALTYSSTLRPAAALLDVAVAGLISALPTLRRVAPHTRLIALAANETDPETLLAAEAGIVGFVGRDQTLDSVAAAIFAVVKGEAYLPPRLGALLLARLQDAHSPPILSGGYPASLTRRERDVYFLLTRGLSNAEIANRLFIGIPTVKSHVRSVVRKLGLSCRRELLSDSPEPTVPARQFGMTDPRGV